MKKVLAFVHKAFKKCLIKLNSFNYTDNLMYPSSPGNIITELLIPYGHLTLNLIVVVVISSLCHLTLFVIKASIVDVMWITVSILIGTFHFQ